MPDFLTADRLTEALALLGDAQEGLGDMTHARDAEQAEAVLAAVLDLVQRAEDQINRALGALTTTETD